MTPTTLPDSEPLADKAKAHILVVEDHIVQRFMLAEWLRGDGYLVLEATSADEATVILASKYRVDLVVTDIWMPGMLDGFDLVRYIRRAFPRLHVIVTSGVYSGQDLNEEYTTYFKKPFDLPDISSCIARLLAGEVKP